MVKPLLLVIVSLAVGGCSTSHNLPGGYTVSYGDRGKAWLQNPDGTIAYAGLVKRLLRDQSRILLVAYPASSGGEVAQPFPIDNMCYVAFVIDGSTQRMSQIHLAQADRVAAQMSEVESYERPCLKGMPNTPS